MKFTLGSKINHPSFGEGVIFGMDDTKYKIYFKEIGEKELAQTYDGYELLEAAEPVSGDQPIALEDIVTAVENVFDQYLDAPTPVDMADKWDEGKLIIKPGNEDLQSKEIPLDIFFKKITSVREKLRVLEQNINNHSKLNEGDKIHLQQYISRAYGSLTTFNILFKHKGDQFSSK